MSTLRYQIPRIALVWLTVSHIVVIAPHVTRIPIWIFFAWIFSVAWRVQIYRGVWPYPNRWVKYAMVFICIAGLITEYERFYGLEPMVALLITAFTLKLLEMQSKRDALLVVFLGYFVAATQFLFSQSLITSFYLLAAITFLTSSLVALQYQNEKFVTSKNYFRSLSISSKLLAQSIPLAIVLFIVMPRVGSLWAVPQVGSKGVTGISDSMSPGDFSNLVKSEKTAFRVTFKNRLPQSGELYWRGLVLSRFDGRRWTQSFFDRSQINQGSSSLREKFPEVNLNNRLQYDVILEPTQRHWLFAIPMADITGIDAVVTRDYRWIHRKPIRNRLQYSVTSYLDRDRVNQSLSERDYYSYTYIPDIGNSRSKQFSKQQFAESNNDVSAFISRVLDFYNASFVYTLQPPLLERNSIDQFLFQTQQGFCEHFASSFTFLMRAAGVPARVVIGYQGGKWNEVEGFLKVSQSDAHAWSEVWLQGQGWVRVDPTTAVAPQRIMSGLESALAENERDLLTGTFSLSRYSHFAFINRLQIQLEALEYGWHRLVMGYDQQRQTQFLTQLMGAVTPLKLAMLLLVPFALVMCCIAVYFLMTGTARQRAPADKLFTQFEKRLSRYGINRLQGEGARSFANRVASQHPDLSSWAKQFVDTYEAVVYANEATVLELKARLKQSSI